MFRFKHDYCFIIYVTSYGKKLNMLEIVFLINNTVPDIGLFDAFEFMSLSNSKNPYKLLIC